ncbi:hypothetical protein IGB42_00570 [Andreprevotia sp. IGB-42]|uniref:hypothetical protein n=1 Tax=Andreprevotia sp. IGB-42 TaxID=2497473 RepID=UPI001357C4B8|nr:hypothetical protein [Andreprevotia sp. IGB-42]KAF0814516.1 hypothetical protein IGB42_00570 [Andreprevotia sp. IGB-42]
MKKVIGIMLLSMLFTGCASVSKQAFNKEAAQNIKSVTFARQDVQETYAIQIVAHPGFSGGLIGGLIAAADMADKTDKLTAKLDPKVTKLREKLSQQLVDALGQAGYVVDVVNAPGDDAPITTAAAMHGKVKTDAVLATRIYAAYIAAGASTPYYPYVHAEVVLEDNKTGKVLYQDIVSYGYTFPNAKTVHLAGGENFRFADMTELLASPDKARDGLVQGVQAIIGQVAADLTKN